MFRLFVDKAISALSYKSELINVQNSANLSAILRGWEIMSLSIQIIAKVLRDEHPQSCSMNLENSPTLVFCNFALYIDFGTWSSIPQHGWLITSSLKIPPGELSYTYQLRDGRFGLFLPFAFQLIGILALKFLQASCLILISLDMVDWDCSYHLIFNLLGCFRYWYAWIEPLLY